MTFPELKFLILADLIRYREELGVMSLLKEYFFGRGFKYLFWFRISKYLETKGKAFLPVKLMARLIRRRLSFLLGIDIGMDAEIGPGLKIEHFGTIMINGKARIGKRCSILQGVTLGEYLGAPDIGDFVFLGPGSKVIGAIRIGTNVIVGANCVVTKDIEDDAVVVGVPGIVISHKGNLRDQQLDVVNRTNRIYQSICPSAFWQRYGLGGDKEG